MLPTTPTLPRRGANKSWQVTLGQLDAPLDNSFKLWAGVSRTKKIGNTTHKRSRIVWGWIFVCQFCSFGKFWYIKNDLSKKYQQQCDHQRRTSMVIQTFNDIQCVYLFYFRHMSDHWWNHPRSQALLTMISSQGHRPQLHGGQFRPHPRCLQVLCGLLQRLLPLGSQRELQRWRFLGPFKSGRCLVNHGTPNSGSIEKQWETVSMRMYEISWK